MIMKQLIAAFALMFLAISATALAPSVNIRFAHLDNDMHGAVSLAEAKQDKEVMRQFADLDENQDKKISMHPLQLMMRLLSKKVKNSKTKAFLQMMSKLT